MNKDTRSQSDTFRHCCDRQSKDKRSYIYEVSLMSKDTRSQGDTFLYCCYLQSYKSDTFV